MDAIYKLSVILTMVDNISNPIKNSQSNITAAITRLENYAGIFGDITQTGALISGLGVTITEGILAPVQATFATKQALGELASLGVEDLELLESAARDFSNTWAGTSAAEFITASYDIKSGIASLTDEGIVRYTEFAGITATATKSTVATMTDLYATGYGIYKSFYSNMSDIEWAEMFSAGIAETVKGFKTSGTEMASAIKTLGASATTAQVPLEEQLSVLGMLQTTMSGSEAGTKYKAFLRNAAKGGEALGLNFMDANNQLLSMPDILSMLRDKFGDTMDAAEKMELQKAFGDQTAVELIDLMYDKTGDLKNSIVSLYEAMGQGEQAAIDMAEAINSTDPAKWDVIKNKVQNLTEIIGNALNPTVSETMDKVSGMLDKVTLWAEEHQELLGGILQVVFWLGIFLTLAGGAITIVGGVGLIFTKTATMILMFGGIFSKLIGAIAMGIPIVKAFVLGLVSMAKQAVITALQAFPGLISAVGRFTVALLTNPITWIVLGIMALIAALYLLHKHWDTVTDFLESRWEDFTAAIQIGVNWIGEKIDALPEPLQTVIKIVMFLIGLPVLLVTNWDKVKDVFKNITGRWRDTLQAGIQGIKEFFEGIPEWFEQKGEEITLKFAEGIKKFIASPAETFEGALQKIRNMLPFSDAKEGPLDSLTLSGNRVLETLSTGIEQAEDLPSKAVEKSFEEIDLDLSATKLKKSKAAASDDAAYTEDTIREKNNPSKKTTIQKLEITVDFNKIEKIPKLLALLDELEDYTNTGDSDIDEDDLVFA